MNLGIPAIIIGIVLLGGGGYFYIQPAPISVLGTGSPCLQSAILPYSFTPCPSATTFIDNFLYATSATSASGLWGGSQVPNLGGFLKVYYFLAQGAVIQSYAITYNAGNGFVTLPAVALGSDAGSGLTWFGAPVPSPALPSGYMTDFHATLTDQLGGSSTKDGFFTYTPAIANTQINFVVYDGTNTVSTGQTPPLPNIQIIITSSSTGATVGQVITNSGGVASLSLPFGVYLAQPTNPATYYPATPTLFSTTTAPNPITYTMYHGPACSASGQANCYPPCVGSACNYLTVYSCNSSLAPGVTSTVATQSGIITIATSCTTLSAQTSFPACPPPPGYTGYCISTTTINGLQTTFSFSVSITSPAPPCSVLPGGVNPCPTSTGGPSVGTNQLIGAGLVISGAFSLLFGIVTLGGSKRRG